MSAVLSWSSLGIAIDPLILGTTVFDDDDESDETSQDFFEPRHVEGLPLKRISEVVCGGSFSLAISGRGTFPIFLFFSF